MGHTWTHLPQLVHVGDSPHGVPMSVTTRASMPEPMTSHVWAPSISAQTRTQRTHMMQRLWSIANSGWLASMPTVGLIIGSSKWSTPSPRPGPGARSGCWRRTPQQMWLRSTNSISVIVRRYSASSLGLRRDLHALGDGGRAGRRELGRAGDLDDAQPARPVSDSPSRWHIVGMSMPFSSATARIVCPSAPGDVGAVDPERVDRLMPAPPAERSCRPRPDRPGRRCGRGTRRGSSAAC